MSGLGRVVSALVIAALLAPALHAADVDKLLPDQTSLVVSLNVRQIVASDLFKKHGFSPAYQETAGGHTWINWQKYLHEFAPQLFQ